MRNFRLFNLFFAMLAVLIISSCGTDKSASNSDNSFKNLVARMQVKEPIEGVCDNDNVYAMLSLFGNGQVKAEAPKSKEEIMKELNSEVNFLKDKPDYEDEGIVSLIVNCQGEMVRCKIDNETKSPELDEQIVAVFAKMKRWKPAKINEYSVDSIVLYSFTIENGRINVK